MPSIVLDRSCGDPPLTLQHNLKRAAAFVLRLQRQIKTPTTLRIVGGKINGDATVKQPSSKAESNFAHRVITL
jgi:hypothetical protein